MDDISKVSATESTSLRKALEIIQTGGAQIALIVDSDKRLLGTLTDGDVRRGLLLDCNLDSPVSAVMNRSYQFVREGEKRNLIVKLLKENSLRQMPVVDESGRVKKLILLDELERPIKLNNAVVIMAGGKGTRLRPHTENCPKPMLRIGDKHMLEILIEQCIASGFRRFYISVNYLKEQIIEYFANGHRWGVSIDYLVENEPLGTAGSLRLLPDSLIEPFLVLNGDVLTRLDTRKLLEFHSEHQAQATLCVREHEFSVPFGVVQTRGVELAGFEEKPTYRHLVNAGIYVIAPQLLQLLTPNQATDMPSLLQAAQRAGHRVAVCPIHEYWIDVGRPDSLKEAHTTWEDSK